MASVWAAGALFLMPAACGASSDGQTSQYTRESDREIRDMTEDAHPVYEARNPRETSAETPSEKTIGKTSEKPSEKPSGSTTGNSSGKASGTSYGNTSATAPVKPVSEKKYPTGEVREKQWLNVAYGTASSAQKMDIFLPSKGIAPFPVIMVFHGRGEDKASMNESWRTMGLSHGYAVVCVDYRETPEARFPSDVMDAKAAVRYLKANAAKYNLDSSHIAAWGASYGGRLAAFLGTSSSRPELEEDSIGIRGKSSRVNAVVTWFPELDDLHMDRDFKALGIRPAISRNEESYGLEMYGAPITTIPELVAFSNPVRYAGPDAAPFFILHGTEDPICPISQSEGFADKLRHIIGSSNVEYVALKGAGHRLEHFMEKSTMDRVFKFLDKRLKVKPKKK